MRAVRILWAFVTLDTRPIDPRPLMLPCEHRKAMRVHRRPACKG